MELMDLKMSEFVTVLSSDEPAPGGGSVSALAGSLGAALTMMVAQLTIGKKKYADYQQEMNDVLIEMKALCNELMDSVEKDTIAFNGVSDVFSMPKITEEEKEMRKQAMQKALKNAALSPFHMMEVIVQALQLTKRAVGKSNTNAASDLGVAALNLKSGLQGAWLNVLINLSGIKDQAFVMQYKQAGEQLVREGCQIADTIYEEILTQM